jgi:multiple sugar transport system permease protein
MSQATTIRTKRRPTRTRAHTALALVICGLMLFPMYWMVNVSLTRPQDLISNPPRVFPTRPTLAGYELAFHTQLPSLVTSLVIGVGCVLLTLAIAMPAAYGMSKLKAPGTGLILFLFMIAQMVPGIMLVMALYTIYQKLGLLNSYPGLILADATAAVPLAVIVLRAYMLTIPDELIEAAQLDGLGRWRTFTSIIVPLSRNAIVTAALFAFLFAWADFLNANSLTTGNSIVPFTVGLYRYIGSQTTNWNGVMATAVLASVPATFLLIIAQRYVAAGVTAGAVKD